MAVKQSHLSRQVGALLTLGIPLRTLEAAADHFWALQRCTCGPDPETAWMRRCTRRRCPQTPNVQQLLLVRDVSQSQMLCLEQQTQKGDVVPDSAHSIDSKHVLSGAGIAMHDASVWPHLVPCSDVYARSRAE